MNKIKLYVSFAARYLKGNVMLAILMITATGVAISASMATLSLLSAMAQAPEPELRQTAQLVALQSDGWGGMKKDWSHETERICDGKSSGWVRLLL
jgi:hypothetical protein